VRDKKFDRPPCVSHRSVVDGGTPPRGGPPLGGPPLGGVPPSFASPLFSKNSKKKRHLAGHKRILDPKNPVFGGVPKMTVFGRF
jgi:hypothetical protein